MTKAVLRDGIDALVDFRSSIDNIDAALVAMLAERFRLTRTVGALKASLALPPSDLEREARQIKRVRDLAQASDSDPDIAERIMRFIIVEVVRQHVAFRREAVAATGTQGGNVRT